MPHLPHLPHGGVGGAATFLQQYPQHELQQQLPHTRSQFPQEQRQQQQQQHQLPLDRYYHYYHNNSYAMDHLYHPCSP